MNRYNSARPAEGGGPFKPVVGLSGAFDLAVVLALHPNREAECLSTKWTGVPHLRRVFRRKCGMPEPGNSSSVALLKRLCFETPLFPAILSFVAVSITVLASGSGGNSTVIATSQTRVLIDCGLSCRETCRRLAAQGIAPESLSAILITHEHSDHVAGLHVMAKKFRLPVFMTAPTHGAWQRQFKDSAGNRVQAERLELFSSGKSFQRRRYRGHALYHSP